MKNKGFSFVELLVAIAILGIISLPIASSFALSAKIDAKARETYSASNAADDILLLVTEIDSMPEVAETVSDAEAEYPDLKTAHYIREWITDSIPESAQDDTLNGEFVTYLYSFEYQGYDVELKLTDLSSFYRVDITLSYVVAGDAMQITRKGVLPIA